MSLRYAPAVCVVLALALVPTLIHSYAGLVVADGRGTASVSPTLAGYSSTKLDRRESWGGRLFEATDWSERRYVSGVDAVLLTIIRSYDLKSLYHHPELAVAYGTSFTRNEVQYLGPAGDIPVHVLDTEDPTGPVGMYVLHYDKAFITDPIWFQIRTAGELLVGGRRQMTLFFARGERRRTGQTVADLPWAPVLFQAIQQFLAEPPAANGAPEPGTPPKS